MGIVIAPLIVLAVWFVMVRLVLPRLGVST
jgi:hypothetical protein